MLMNVTEVLLIVQVTSFGGSVTAIADAKAMASVGSRRHLLLGGI